MFELYTQSARRVIFLARDEAMRCGSAFIESEHLLLGILRENETVATRIVGPKSSASEFRKEIEGKTTIGQPISGPTEVPLSTDSKRILTLAMEEAGTLGQKQVSIAHFLLAILRVETSTAAEILQACGATILGLREKTIRDVRWADAPD